MKCGGWQKRFNHHVTRAGPLEVLFWFLIACGTVVMVASTAGFYDHNVDDEAHVNMEYRPPAGDRRY